MSSEKRLFIIDDEESLLAVLNEFLQQFGLKVFVYQRMPDLKRELLEKRPHAVLYRRSGYRGELFKRQE